MYTFQDQYVMDCLTITFTQCMYGSAWKRATIKDLKISETPNLWKG